MLRRFNISLSAQLLRDLDKIKERSGYATITEVIRHACIDLVKKEGKSNVSSQF